MSFIISIDGIDTSYNATPVLKNIRFEIEKGDFVGIVGPNGSGKTTLLSNIGRLVPYQSGKIILGGKDLQKYRHKEAAQWMSAVTQHSPANIDFNVYDVVMMGRYPYWGFFQGESPEDIQIVEHALALAEISHLADKKVDELSGGERQRVFIAQAIAQKPQLMLLDEPTAHLDIHFQIGIMDVLKRLNQDQKTTIIAVLHDLNLAAQYCQKIVMLKEGMIVGIGTPREVITAELITDVYQCKVTVAQHPATNAPYVVLYSNDNDHQRIETAHQLKIHLISGGGSGVSIMEKLTRRGHSITSGVLNIGDTDWQKAKELSILVIEEMPFSHVTLEKKEENLIAARKSDVVILTPTPVGFGNLANIEILEELFNSKVRLIIMDAEQLPERDYTDGQATAILERLIQSGQAYPADEDNLDSVLKNISEGR